METDSPLPETLSAAIQALLRGQDSAKKLREVLSTVAKPPVVKEESEWGGGGGGGRSRLPPTASDLVADVLRSFTSTLSILNCVDSDGDGVSQLVPPLGHCDVVVVAAKPEASEESSKSSAPRGRRGCYKRRRNSDSWTKLSPNLADDGHQWRKYGQKSILNTDFPRSYFRCTHKADQGCRATKQVQKTSDHPPVYRTIYHGQHTCRDILKAPPQIILTDDPSPRGSSILLSFSAPAKSPDSNSNNTIPFSSSSFPSTTTVKHEEDKGWDAPGTNRSSSEYDNFPSPDFTALESTIQSEQGEALSSSHSFGDDDMNLMIDGVDIDEILLDNYNFS